MFCLIILLLRSTGKRGIRQLSIFELTIILALGSIAGDPMFTEDLPLIQAVLIMSLVLFLYRFFTWFSTKHKLFELLLEGKPTYIVENGMLIMEDVKKGKMSHDEFFAEMRQKKIEHLGQVKMALLETDGCLSVIPYSKENIKWGLPLFPDEYQIANHHNVDHFYSCMLCGQTQLLNHLKEECPRCQNTKWAKSCLYCEEYQN